MARHEEKSRIAARDATGGEIVTNKRRETRRVADSNGQSSPTSPRRRRTRRTESEMARHEEKSRIAARDATGGEIVTNKRRDAKSRRLERVLDARRHEE